MRSLLARLSRIDVLVIEDRAMAPLLERERRDFREIGEDRDQVRSTILTSRHRIEMRGDSMRKNRGKA